MERRAPRDPRAAVYERIYAVVRRIPRGERCFPSVDASPIRCQRSKLPAPPIAA